MRPSERPLCLVSVLSVRESRTETADLKLWSYEANVNSRKARHVGSEDRSRNGAYNINQSNRAQLTPPGRTTCEREIVLK